ncbi:hypothetical protein [Nocardioides pantholopis]|uniref:hypothetical protein n=1 Tax=Nocardioides pantholopis TaxID=2483798 RepID=UPI000F08FCE0|nr:hypothetical protein [Nocardioides pantholopis]
MRPDRVDTWLRWSRGCVVAAVALATGLVAHVSAGGGLPSAPWLAALLLAIAAVCAHALRRPASTTRVVALVAGGQMAGHLVLTALAGHGGDHPQAAAPLPRPEPAPMVGAGERRGSLYDLTIGSRPDDLATQQPALPHWVTHLVEDLTGANALMALAHLAAAAALGWWLARGEHALWTLLCLTGAEARAFPARLRAAAALVGAAPAALLVWVAARLGARPTAYADDRRETRWHHDVLPRVVGRRGPPVPAC